MLVTGSRVFRISAEAISPATRLRAYVSVVGEEGEVTGLAISSADIHMQNDSPSAPERKRTAAANSNAGISATIRAVDLAVRVGGGLPDLCIDHILRMGRIVGNWGSIR